MLQWFVAGNGEARTKAVAGGWEEMVIAEGFRKWFQQDLVTIRDESRKELRMILDF